MKRKAIFSILIAFVLICMSSVTALAATQPIIDPVTLLETDPASGEQIYHHPAPGATMEEATAVIYPGFANLANAGQTYEQFDLFKEVIETYGACMMTETPLHRVSLKKDSITFGEIPGIWHFTIVLNIDQVTMDVMIRDNNFSTNPGTAGNMSMEFSQGDEIVWRF